MGIVGKTWDLPAKGTYMVKVWNKLKKIKEAMKVLNRKEYSKVEQRIRLLGINYRESKWNFDTV